MSVPYSEVGYTPAMPRREDHEVHKDMWGHGGEKIKQLLSFTLYSSLKFLYHLKDKQKLFMRVILKIRYGVYNRLHLVFLLHAVY